MNGLKGGSRSSGPHVAEKSTDSLSKRNGLKDGAHRRSNGEVSRNAHGYVPSKKEQADGVERSGHRNGVTEKMNGKFPDFSSSKFPGIGDSGSRKILENGSEKKSSSTLNSLKESSRTGRRGSEGSISIPVAKPDVKVGINQKTNLENSVPKRVEKGDGLGRSRHQHQSERGRSGTRRNDSDKERHSNNRSKSGDDCRSENNSQKSKPNSESGQLKQERVSAKEGLSTHSAAKQGQPMNLVKPSLQPTFGPRIKFSIGRLGNNKPGIQSGPRIQTPPSSSIGPSKASDQAQQSVTSISFPVPDAPPSQSQPLTTVSVTSSLSPNLTCQSSKPSELKEISRAGDSVISSGPVKYNTNPISKTEHSVELESTKVPPASSESKFSSQQNVFPSSTAINNEASNLAQNTDPSPLPGTSLHSEAPIQMGLPTTDALYEQSSSAFRVSSGISMGIHSPAISVPQTPPLPHAFQLSSFHQGQHPPRGIPMPFLHPQAVSFANSAPQQSLLGSPLISGLGLQLPGAPGARFVAPPLGLGGPPMFMPQQQVPPANALASVLAAFGLQQGNLAALPPQVQDRLISMIGPPVGFPLPGLGGFCLQRPPVSPHHHLLPSPLRFSPANPFLNVPAQHPTESLLSTAPSSFPSLLGSPLRGLSLVSSTEGGFAPEKKRSPSAPGNSQETDPSGDPRPPSLLDVKVVERVTNGLVAPRPADFGDQEARVGPTEAWNNRNKPTNEVFPKHDPTLPSNAPNPWKNGRPEPWKPRKAEGFREERPNGREEDSRERKRGSSRDEGRYRRHDQERTQCREAVGETMRKVTSFRNRTPPPRLSDSWRRNRSRSRDRSSDRSRGGNDRNRRDYDRRGRDRSNSQVREQQYLWAADRMLEKKQDVALERGFNGKREDQRQRDRNIRRNEEHRGRNEGDQDGSLFKRSHRANHRSRRKGVSETDLKLAQLRLEESASGLLLGDQEMKDEQRPPQASGSSQEDENLPDEIEEGKQDPEGQEDPRAAKFLAGEYLNDEGIIELEEERILYIRCSPADLYYRHDEEHFKTLHGTPRLTMLCDKFEADIIRRGDEAWRKLGRDEEPGWVKLEPLPDELSTPEPEEEEELEEGEMRDDTGRIEKVEKDLRTLQQMERRQRDPDRLHPQIWHNDPGYMNDGDACKCSPAAKKCGIRHSLYVGERAIPRCNPNTNNAGSLFHYRITISPPTNFLVSTITAIPYDGHEFLFEGFSMFSHFPIESYPVCSVIRFNIQYTILYVEEVYPQNFTIRELDLFQTFLMRDILELLDFNMIPTEDEHNEGCGMFHFYPRFVRDLPDKGQEILSICHVLQYLLRLNQQPVVSEKELGLWQTVDSKDWQSYVDTLKGMIVTCPGKKPSSVRLDQLDRDKLLHSVKNSFPYPEIVHFGLQPAQLYYAGSKEYQAAFFEYRKFRHSMACMKKPSDSDKAKLSALRERVKEIRLKSRIKRDVTIGVSCEGFYQTGIYCDVTQHALCMPVLVSHLRFHRSLHFLEESIGYSFKNRSLLQLALTHPSYREKYGTNADHARNSISNCGIRRPEYGDKKILYATTKKRGIMTLIQIMSRFGREEETESKVPHNERLEFLGDAVVEYIATIHLFFLFPNLEEGGLATYRSAIVQNQHFAVLARKIELEKFLLYAHGTDLCHDSELRHALANCFEALMAAVFLDSDIQTADRVFAGIYWKGEAQELFDIWTNLQPHPLQEQEPFGDRHWIPNIPILQRFLSFEESIGYQFKHIRLLVRSFCDHSIAFNNLTLGSNQRLEFLGDSVLQLLTSDYLYRHFPEHHEGHLSLLRSSLVNNKTQATICDQLNLSRFVLMHRPAADLRTKDKADLMEALIGAMCVDAYPDLDYCRSICNVCFFPQLREFIINQDWNDPKSKLQQCCLTLRRMNGGDPDLPVYRVIECKGPTNTRIYKVGVYFRGKCLAACSSHSIQSAEMLTATEALKNCKDLFPQLEVQKQILDAAHRAARKEDEIRRQKN